MVPTFIADELDRESKITIALSKFTATELATGPQATHDLDLWVTPLSNRLATEMLAQLANKNNEKDGLNAKKNRLQLVKHVLLSYIKPLFTTTPHPMLNPDTGRKLDRRRGGDLFGDSYMDGEWKGRSIDADDVGAVGCWKTYLYILTLIDVSESRSLPVYSLIPPPLTLSIYFTEGRFRRRMAAVGASYDDTPR